MVLTKNALTIAGKMITCASTDATRWPITALKIEATQDGVTRLIATDGHKMAVRYVKDATRITRDLYLPRLDAEKPLKAFLKEAKKLDPVAELQGVDDGKQVRFEFGAAILKAETEYAIPSYPAIDQVIPTKSAYLEFSINADYIAQIAAALQDSEKHNGIIVRIFAPHDPVMIFASGERSRDLGVIMPMRQSGADSWPVEVREALATLETAYSTDNSEQATA